MCEEKKSFKTRLSRQRLVPKQKCQISFIFHCFSYLVYPCPFQRIFVWDLDETIIIFHSLLTGSYATRFGKVSSLFFVICNFHLLSTLFSRLVSKSFLRVYMYYLLLSTCITCYCLVANSLIPNICKCLMLS